MGAVNYFCDGCKWSGTSSLTGDCPECGAWLDRDVTEDFQSMDSEDYEDEYSEEE